MLQGHTAGALEGTGPSAWALQRASRGLDRVVRWGSRALRFDYGGRLCDLHSGNEVIRQCLATGNPALVARIGATEQWAIRRYHRSFGLGAQYPKGLCAALATNAGFFPAVPAAIDAMSELYCDAVSDAAVFAPWFNRGERRIINGIVPRTAKLVPLWSLTPMREPTPWTAALKGRHVLIIHPFERSIVSQLTRLDDALPGFWPECTIEVQRSVQSIGGVPDGPWASWFEALQYMTSRIDSSNADVVLVGAGAYGLPLAHHAFLRGKQAVVVGGGLQLFFGIRGRRWDEHPHFAPIVNDAWIRPHAEERPATAGAVENGCYW